MSPLERVHGSIQRTHRKNPEEKPWKRTQKRVQLLKSWSPAGSKPHPERRGRSGKFPCNDDLITLAVRLRKLLSAESLINAPQEMQLQHVARSPFLRPMWERWS